jgi:hypothetical protein
MSATGPGIKLPDRYRVFRHIANGGMATVWAAEDALLERLVAVKVLSPVYGLDPSAAKRFQREARAGARISDHPHVVTVYDIGDCSGQPFMVMEYFTGGTVADRVAAATPVPHPTAVRWLAEAADALDVAHAQQIVHRDVKPANLLLDERGRLAVGDFGIARLATDSALTQTGTVLGTAAYISPEQAMGQPATAASDRYGLAVVAFELLTGRRPFDAEGAAGMARAHAEDPPPSAHAIAPDLPAAIDAVLARGLAKDPGERPATATAFVDALRDALGAQAEPRHVEPLAQTAVTAPLAAVAAVEPPRPPAPPPPSSAAPVAPRPPAPVAPRRPRVPAPAVAARAADPGPGPGSRPARTKRTALVAAILAAAATALILALVAGGSGDDGRSTAQRSVATTEKRATSAPRRTTKTASTPAPAPAAPAASTSTSAPPAAAPATGGRTPVALNDDGYARLQRGDVAGALPLLQASVDGYRKAGDRRSLGYAFAVFNLATALRRSGRSAEAVPLIQERLAVSDNQRGTVERALAQAQAEAGGAPPAAPGKAKKQNGD